MANYILIVSNTLSCDKNNKWYSAAFNNNNNNINLKTATTITTTILITIAID